MNSLNIEEKVNILRRALIGLIGAETEDELITMEAILWDSSIPDKEKVITVNAIHALIDTM